MIVLTYDKELYFIDVKTLKHNIANIPLKKEDGFFGTSVRLINNEFQVSYKNFVGILDDNYNLKESYHIDPKYEAHANLIDKDGNIWLGSFTTGIHFTSKEEAQSQTKNITKQAYAPVWFEEDIYFVSNGNVGTFNKNKSIIESKNYIYLSGQLNDKLYYFIDRQVQLIVVKDNTNKKITTYKNGEAFKYGATKILELNESEYLIKDYSQIHIFDKNFEYKKTYPFIASDIYLFQDSILLISNNGLFYLDRESEQIKPTSIEEPISSIAQLNDGLILGTSGKGLIFYKNGKTINLPLNNVSIKDIEVFNDSLIFCATNKGVICLRKQKNTFIPYYNYTRKDGLKSNKTNGLAIDNENNIYVTTKKGITKTKVVFPDGNFKKLENIIVKNIIWNNKQIKNKESFEVLHKKRSNLEIDFDAIYFDVKPQIEYAYRVLGKDKEFRPLQNGQLLLNDLPIGKYEIELQISVPFIESIRKSIKFEITPKWTQTNWFIVSMVLLGIFIIYLIVKKSIDSKTEKKMEGLEKEAVFSNFKLLALRSQMNPHFVFNSLNAIQYYITENQNDLSEKYLLSFAKLVRQFFDLSEVGKINLKQEIELLNNYLVLEKMRFENKLDFKISVDEKLNTKTTEIPTMLLQPIVENAVNHGIFHKETVGLVTVNFIFIAKNEYLVEIIDDGIGVKNSKELKAKSMQGHKSKSTFIITERIELLNKTNEWIIECYSENLSEDVKYPGTKVSITIKRTL